MGMVAPSRLNLPEWLVEMRGGNVTTNLAVADYFPLDFPAFSRVFNPARAAAVTRRWAEVAGSAATVTGRTQWQEIADGQGAADLPRLDPAMGSLDSETAAALASILAGNTQTPDSVYFFAWEGYAGLSDAFRASATILGPYGRPMHVLHGSLRDVGPSVAARESEMPLWWIPEDGSWAVGNDIYARSVYVGGTASCIDEILHDHRVEGVPVAASDIVVAEDD